MLPTIYHVGVRPNQSNENHSRREHHDKWRLLTSEGFNTSEEADKHILMCKSDVPHYVDVEFCVLTYEAVQYTLMDANNVVRGSVWMYPYEELKYLVCKGQTSE